ncbi:Cadmium resistance transcriptional regulatory protein CadC [Marine Group I thaumarchaeote SCGC RSA3]|uniref:Cadmium resistance transcriptional regulatory protein CadC n=1 Tax=Marine Group I thaumarchaeote SCGC RSA3 TaxID=1503183 RepID=A0A087RQ04_9ARCH|nr:Cadmium resistance transcriptional regulatory protein CadC [Marine Group I thaumarchaeote SCGC RSA3]
MNGVSLLKCICDDTRFEILELLQKNKELCVNDFVEKLKKDQPLVSHHLKTLKKCGIVKSRDEGKKAMYAISSANISDIKHNCIICK